MKRHAPASATSSDLIDTAATSSLPPLHPIQLHQSFHTDENEVKDELEENNGAANIDSEAVFRAAVAASEGMMDGEDEDDDDDDDADYCMTRRRSRDGDVDRIVSTSWSWEELIHRLLPLPAAMGMKEKEFQERIVKRFESRLGQLNGSQFKTYEQYSQKMRSRHDHEAEEEEEEVYEENPGSEGGESVAKILDECTTWEEFKQRMRLGDDEPIEDLGCLRAEFEGRLYERFGPDYESLEEYYERTEGRKPLCPAAWVKRSNISTDSEL